MSVSWTRYKRDFHILDSLEGSDHSLEDSGSDSQAPKSRAEKALNIALDIRKFEIGLYWTRAAYFWTFIGVTLAAYGAELGANDVYPKKAEILLVISCVGLVLSVAWHMVNRASKFWQENWEKHVDLLEDGVIGPLYKTVTQRSEINWWHLSGPYQFSVSKVNHILSFFTVLLFLFMASGAVYRGCHCYRVIPFPWFVWIAILLTVGSVIALMVRGQTERILPNPSGKPNVVAQRRRTRLGDYD